MTSRHFSSDSIQGVAFEEDQPEGSVGFQYPDDEEEQEQAPKASQATSQAAIMLRLLRWVGYYDKNLHCAKSVQPLVKYWTLRQTLEPNTLTDDGTPLNLTELADRLGVAKTVLGYISAQIEEELHLPNEHRKPWPQARLTKAHLQEQSALATAEEVKQQMLLAKAKAEADKWPMFEFMQATSATKPT